MERTKILLRTQRDLGLLRDGGEGAGAQGEASGPEALAGLFKQADSLDTKALPVCMSSVKLSDYCEPQGPCLEKERISHKLVRSFKLNCIGMNSVEHLIHT